MVIATLFRGRSQHNSHVCTQGNHKLLDTTVLWLWCRIKKTLIIATATCKPTWAHHTYTQTLLKQSAVQLGVCENIQWWFPWGLAGSYSIIVNKGTATIFLCLLWFAYKHTFFPKMSMHTISSSSAELLTYIEWGMLYTCPIRYMWAKKAKQTPAIAVASRKCTLVQACTMNCQCKEHQTIALFKLSNPSICIYIYICVHGRNWCCVLFRLVSEGGRNWCYVLFRPFFS